MGQREGWGVAALGCAHWGVKPATFCSKPLGPALGCIFWRKGGLLLRITVLACSSASNHIRSQNLGIREQGPAR